MILFLLLWTAVALLGAFGLGHLIRARSQPAASPEMRQFWRRFADRIRTNHPRVEVRGAPTSEFGVVLGIRGQTVALPLAGVRARVAADPARFAEIVDLVVQEARTRLASGEDRDFARVRERILPVTRTDDWLRANAPLLGEARFVIKPRFDDCHTCFVIDAPGSQMFVTAGHLQRWHMTADELENLARDNERGVGAARVSRTVPAVSPAVSAPAAAIGRAGCAPPGRGLPVPVAAREADSHTRPWLRTWRALFAARRAVGGFHPAGVSVEDREGVAHRDRTGT